ncbi:Protein kinase domain-containing protein [Mycena chlorophos]|uniref:Protein kinase domain-containing protein n=1 Tax=Mycena chlorophos TaxID=658473 RepID=A0A8H6WFK5_MYCCL|nr:Protein kinase domain-containing protein [Mycena chlorophos]
MNALSMEDADGEGADSEGQNLRSAGFDPVDSNALLQNIGQVNQCSATGPAGTVSCASGFILCSGKCVPGTACPTGPSAIPRAVNHDAKKITTLEQAQRECKTGYSVCGVASVETKYDFSCVNTATDLENCGGCAFPSPWQTESQQPLSSELARGFNCGPILNAKAASCVAGQCVVEKCRCGFEVNDQRDGCVHKRRVARRTLLDINIGGPEPVFPPPQAATSFGLGPQFAPHVAGICLRRAWVLGTTDPEQLVPNVNSAIAAAQAAHNGCDPSQTDWISALEQLLDGLLGLLSECPSGKVPTIPAAPECDDVVLTRLVCGLVSSIYVSPFFVCGLGDPLTGLLQNVVDLVGLGPFPFPPPPPMCKVGCAPPLLAAPRGLLDGLLGPAPEATSAALSSSPQSGPSVANVVSGLQAVSAAHGCPSEVIQSNVDIWRLDLFPTQRELPAVAHRDARHWSVLEGYHVSRRMKPSAGGSVTQQRPHPSCGAVVWSKRAQRRPPVFHIPAPHHFHPVPPHPSHRHPSKVVLGPATGE